MIRNLFVDTLKNLTRLSIVTLLLAAATTSHAATIVDDFMDPNDGVPAGWFIRLFNPNNYVLTHDAVTGTIIGGERDVQITVVTPNPASAASANGIVGTDVFEFNSGATSSVIASMMYDGNDGPDGGGPLGNTTMVDDLGLGNLNLTTGGQTGFQFDFLAVAPSFGNTVLDLTITVRNGANSSIAQVAVPGSAGPSSIYVPFSAFNNQIGILAAQSIRFDWNSPNPKAAVDFVLDQISIVPEPASGLLALPAVAALWFVRRRRTV